MFSIAAQTAAYRYGKEYLEEMTAYLERNADLMLEYLDGLEKVHACRPEASFLLWVDCSKLNLNTAGLQNMLLEAGITADPGHYYDMAEIDRYSDFQHHFRLSFGMPRKQLEPAMKKLRKVIQKYS